MTILIEVGSLILICLYLVIIVVEILAILLYRKAYFEMKKSWIIGSVWGVLISLLIQDGYFLAYNFFARTNHPLGELFYIPYFWAIPKVIFLGALIFFIYASIRDPNIPV
jgi:uncharacterized membrane protein